MFDTYFVIYLCSWFPFEKNIDSFIDFAVIWRLGNLMYYELLQVARAAVIFNIDEIVVFEENAANPR